MGRHARPSRGLYTRAMSPPHARRSPRGRLGPALLLLVGCSVAPDGGELADNARFVEFGRARAIEVACETGWASASGERLAQRLGAQSGLPVRVVEPDAPRARRTRRVLIAGPEHPAARRVLEALGERVPELAGFGLAPDPRGGALIATLADPRRADAALTICVAWGGSELVNPGRDLDLERRLEPTWRLGWQRFEGALCVASSDGSPAFVGPPPPARTCAEWAEAEPGLAWLVEAEAQARAAVREAFGEPWRPFDEPRVRLWPDAWSLGRVAGGSAHTFVRPKAALLELSRDTDPSTARGALAELHARALFGEPYQRLTSDAFAVHAARAWWGRDLERWCARLASPALALPPGDLERDADRRPHRALPLAALALEVRLGLRGAEGLREAWNRGARMDAALAEAYEARLTELAALHGAELAREADARRAEVRARPFRRGVNLVLEHPEPGRDEARHGSPEARAALVRARELGADAVALDWASVLRPAPSELAWGVASPRAPWASDVELAASARAARELGLDVLLKPHLWLSEGAGYAGWNLVHNEDEFRAYFDAQRELAVHAALLAELVEADVLCLAAEQRLPSVTAPGHSDASFAREHHDWKRARWHELIASARAAFDGGLTYAALWQSEVQGIEFWDELDFVGLDLFPSLAPPEGAAEFSQRAARGRLWESLMRAAQQAEQLGRPLLVTEFGYPRRGADPSHPERPSGTEDRARQASVIEALADALTLVFQAEPDLAGLYLWDLPVGGADPYGLDGAPLEAAVRRVLALP